MKKNMMVVAVVVCILQIASFAINVTKLVSHVSSEIEIEAFDDDYIRGEDLQYLIKVDGDIDDIAITSSCNGTAYNVCASSNNEAVLTVRTGMIDQFPYTISVKYGTETANIILK